MALELLKQYAEARNQAANEEIQKIINDKPTERPRNDLKLVSNTNTPIDTETVLEGLKRHLGALYKAQHDNIVKSEELRAQIVKGIQEGETDRELLLKSLQCISLMTGDAHYYNYSKGLLDKA